MKEEGANGNGSTNEYGYGYEYDFQESNEKTASSPTFTLTAQAVSDVFKRKTVIVQGKGFSGPKVEKPPSVFNAANLAYIDDSIFELYACTHFLFPPLSLEEHNDYVIAVVRCEVQDALLQKLLNDNYRQRKKGVFFVGERMLV
ncbi:PREDICTED: uncharacterized protein LOC105108262 [Populus euphratica]|uniref:Uncharacterized protein LOC105108262 n=1 Tax=Populus euphratica TaxID=75702 RepID=A0AAJ6X039_POPEU|nr:PREDICTED: uncharacterized protein LOC105108262 [Populus euphratica]